VTFVAAIIKDVPSDRIQSGGKAINLADDDRGCHHP
jgi:hypothetical protein